MTTFTSRAANALLQSVKTRRPEDLIKDADLKAFHLIIADVS